MAESFSETEVSKVFPNEHLSVVCKKLFCEACREHVSVKKSVLEQHFRSAKHGSGKKLLFLRKILKTYNQTI